MDVHSNKVLIRSRAENAQSTETKKKKKKKTKEKKKERRKKEKMILSKASKQ